MPLLIIAFVGSMIPVFGLYFWFKKRPNMPEGHEEACKEAFWNGFKSCLPIVLLSFVSNVVLRLLKPESMNMFYYRLIYDLIVLALVEESMKYVAFKKVIKNRKYSWLSATIYMMTAAMGFEVVESMLYAIESNPIQMLVRGITLMHGAFGFIIGYFYGKAMYTGKKGYTVFGFVISWLLHGIYDFTLSKEAEVLGDIAIFIPVTLALASLIMIIVAIVFVNKAGKNQKYLTIINPNVQA